MEIKDRIIIGFLILTIVSGGIYIQLQDQAKIYVTKDKSTFYVKQDSYWRVSGREYNKLLEGTSRLYRDVSEIVVSIRTSQKDVKIERKTPFKRGPLIIDEWAFDGSTEDVEQFPTIHQVDVYNATGKFYRYEVRDLTYTGPTYKLSGETSLSFGKNMKVTLNPGYRWAWVYKSGIVKAQYDLPSDHETFVFRLFDPTLNSSLYGINGLISNATNYYWNFSDNNSLIGSCVGNYAGSGNPTKVVGKVDDAYRFEGNALDTNCAPTNMSTWWFIWNTSYSAGNNPFCGQKWAANEKAGDWKSTFNSSGSIDYNIYYSINSQESVTATNMVGSNDGQWHMLAFAVNVSAPNGYKKLVWFDGDWVGWSGNQNTLFGYGVEEMFFGSTGHNGARIFSVDVTFDEAGASNVSFTDEYLDAIYNGGEFLGYPFLEPHINLSIEGLYRDVSAELGTTLNVSLESTGTNCVDIDHPSYGKNYVCLQNSSFILNITDFSYDEFKEGTTSNNITTGPTTRTLNLSLDNRSELKFAHLDLACGTGFCENVSLSQGAWNHSFFHENNKSKSMKIYSDFYVDNWFKQSSSGTYIDRLEHVFEDEGKTTIFFDVPTHPRNISFMVYANSSDSDNEVEFDEWFNTTNQSKIYNASTINTSFPLMVFEGFENELTESLWIISESETQKVEDEAQYSTGTTNDYLWVKTNIENLGQTEWRKATTSWLNLTPTSMFKLNIYLHVRGGAGTNYFEGSSSIFISDGTNQVRIHRTADTSDWDAFDLTYTGNITVTRNNPSSNAWKVYENNIYKSAIDTSSLDSSKDWQISVYTKGETGTAGSGPQSDNYAEARIYTIYVGGIGLYKDSNVTDYRVKANYTSNITSTGNSDFVAVTLTANDYVPTGTTLNYFVSSDQHNYESTVSGSRHVFTNTGKNLSYRVLMTTTNTNYTPLVYNVELKVVSSQLSNLSIDLGNDGNSNYNVNITFNDTNTPLNFSFEIQNRSAGTIIPIVFGTDSSGTIIIKNLKINSTLNPVSFNHSLIENCDDCYLNVSTGHLASTYLYVDNLDIRHIGGNQSFNILSHLSDYTQNVSRNLTMYDSDWNYTYPNNVDYMEFIPKRSTDKNVSAYGQTSSTPLMNITSKNFGGRLANFSVHLNETHNCVNISVNRNSSKSVPTRLSSGWTEQISNMNYSEQYGLWWWIDLNCSYSGWRTWSPYLSFRSCCVGCDFCSDEVV